MARQAFKPKRINENFLTEPLSTTIRLLRLAESGRHSLNEPGVEPSAVRCENHDRVLPGEEID